MRLWPTALYNLGLWIMLFALVIDFIISKFNVFNSLFLLPVCLLLLLINNLDETYTMASCFYGLFLGLGSLPGVFCFAVAVYNSHLDNDFAHCSNFFD